MTPEQKRIAIAEACGWKWWVHEPGQNSAHEGKRFLAEDGVWRTYNISREADMTEDVVGVEPLPPDYLTDLNAMHEAEKVLTPHDSNRMTGYLLMLLGEENQASIVSFTAVRQATASQRADAFIATLNLH